MSGEFDAPPVDVQPADLPPAPATPPAPASAPKNEYDTLLAQAPAAAPKPVGNEYDGLVVDLAKERNQRLRATMVGAQGSTPDAAAKAVDLSRKTGLPAELVERNLPKVEGDHKLNEYDAILGKSPKLASWLLADQMNAKVAGAEGDFSSLSFLEHTINEIKRPVFGFASDRQMGNYAQAVYLSRDLENAKARKAAGEPLSMYDEGLLKDEDGVREVVRDTMIDTWGARQRWQQKAAAMPQRPNVVKMQQAGKEGDFGKWWDAFAEDPLGAFYTVGLQSLWLLPAQLGAGAVAGPTGAGIVSFGSEYFGTVLDAMEENGVDINDPGLVAKAFANPELMAKVKTQATIKAGTIGAVDAFSFGVASKFMGIGRTAMTRTATNIPAQVFTQGALGGVGEAGGSVLAGMPVDIHSVASEVMGEAMFAPAEVATANWRGARREDMTRAEAEKFKALPPLEQQATGTAMAIDRIMAVANDTKMATTSPAKLQEFIASVSAQDATVFVPAEAVMTYMQDMTGLQAEQFAARLGIADQLARIANTGEDVAIPLAMYVTGAKDAHAAWREQIRTEVDGFSVKQAQEWEKAKAAELKDLQTKFEEQVQAGVVADPQTLVYQQVLAMAKANGYTNDVAAQHAALYAAHYQARAERNPDRYADALDAFQQAGPGTGVRIQTLLADGTRAMGPDVLDAMLDSIRSGKDPLVPPPAFAHIEARKAAAAAELATVLPEPPAAPKTAKQTAKERNAAALEAFKARRQELADAVSSLGLDIGKMSNAQVRAAIQKEIKGQTLHQPVYHGTPFVFDKFTTDHMGKGEGAQAYGWGLYFAGKKQVAEYYRKALSSGTSEAITYTWRGRKFEGRSGPEAHALSLVHNDGVAVARRIAREGVADANAGKPYAVERGLAYWEAMLETANAVRGKNEVKRTEGRLYHVEIPDDGAYLLHDQKFSRQPVPVRQLVYGILDRQGYSKSPAGFASWKMEHAGMSEKDGEAVYSLLTKEHGSAEGASRALLAAGVPGIKYLDGNSRGKSAGSYNYVIFDGAAAEIVGYEQENRGSITFSDNQTTISLFQARDLSTLAHETGHLWLAEMEHDAKQAGASDKAKADWQTVLDFLDSKGGYITREQHELFARAFETYLMEGKAPSEGLRAVFRSFKNWLVSIYRNLARLQAPISPEMREVFDRLIATDEEIAAARETQGFNPVFADAKSADMTEAEFNAYTRRVTQVVDDAEQKVLEKVMATIRRQRTKEVAAEKAKIRSEVRDELMGDPGNAALHLLRNGKLYAGETPEILKDAKLSRSALVEMLGNDGLKNLPRGIYAETGIDPDDLAEVFGLGNGQELVDRLMQIQAEQDAMRAKGDNRSPLNARIAEETQRRLTESLGDPLNDGSIEAEAMAAVHSDKQGALLSSELKVLARKAGHAGAITLDDLQTWAANTIGEMSVYQATQVAKYQRAERMAGQKVQRALIKGDFVAAFKAKQDQLVNFALYQEARKAADDAEGVRKLADRYASAATIKSMDQGALEQIHQLLEDYDFKKRSGALLAERTTFNMWAAEQAAAGFEVIEPPRLKGAQSRHYSQMTMEEIRGVGDTIKQIAHIGRWKQSMVDAGKKREFEAVVAEAVETAGKIDQRGVSLMRRGTSALQDTLGDVGSWFRSVDAALLKMETIFEWLDNDKTGRGVFSRVVFRRIAQAQVDERDRQKDLAARFAAIYDKVPREQTRAWSKRHVVPELGAKLNKSQMIAVALNTGNASNLQKMLEGEKWDEAAVRAMLDKHLTREEWQFVQDTWDLLESLWPETAAMEKRINGVAPPKVEATPVETPYGTLRGGYYPMAYDKHGDIKADRIAAKGAEGLFDPEYRRASTRAGSTNKRVEGFNAKVLLSLNVIGSHLNEVAHDLAFREAVMDSYKFLSNDKVREAIRSAVGSEYEKQTQVWLKAVANEWAVDRRGLEGVDKFLQGARANTAIVGMGFRVSTMLSQMAGFSNSVQRLGSASMLGGMRDFYKDPMGMAAFVREKSGEMRHRANDLERDIRLALKRMEGKGGTLDNVRRFAFRGVALFDAAVSLPTWMGAYNQGLKQGMSEADAVAYGDKMVRDTQGAGSVKDLSAFQRGSEALKLLGMFYSYFNVYYNRQRGLVRDARAADSFSDYMDVVAQGMWLMVVPTLLAALLAGQGPDDEEEWWAWATRNVGFGVFSGVPWARDVSNALSNQIAGKGFGGAKLSPIQGLGEGIQHLFTDAVHLAKGEDTSKSAIKNTFNVAGLFTGLPTGQLGASTQYVWDVLAEGTERPEGLLDWMQGLAFGPKHKK